MGHEGTGHVTNIGERLLNLRAANGLKAGGNLFWLRNKQKQTWHRESHSEAERSQAGGARQRFGSCVATGHALVQLTGNIGVKVLTEGIICNEGLHNIKGHIACYSNCDVQTWLT